MSASHEHRGTEMGMPRSPLMETVQDATGVTVLIAQGVAALFTVSQVVLALLFLPGILALYASADIELSGLLTLFNGLDWFGTAAFTLIVNGLIFWAFERAARRYWLGLAFVPPLLYLGMTTVFLITVAVPLLIR